MTWRADCDAPLAGCSCVVGDPYARGWSAADDACPPCPRCGLPVGSPFADAAGAAWCQLARPHALRAEDPRVNAYCPACGHAWVASADEHARAVRALAAYQRRAAGERADGEERGR